MDENGATLENEKESIKYATALARAQADAVERQNKENRNLYRIIIAQFVIIAIMLCCMVWAIVNAQKVANEAVKTALDSVAKIGVTQEETTTTTTTQTVDGENAAINNVDGDQYNDNAAHYEGTDK